MMDNEIDIKIETEKRIRPDELSALREERNFKYKMVLTYVLSALVVGSMLIAFLSGVELENAGMKFQWTDKSIDMAWDIIKMSLTGLIGFLLATNRPTDT